MRAKSPALRKVLAEIAANGPLTFARFMSLALYDPETGFYAAGRGKIGRSGDFFTNVSVGTIFGNILAGQFREMWIRLGCPERFALVEQGANDGQLALDILSAMEKEILRALEYWIVEPFTTLRRKQEETLREFGTLIHWTKDLENLPLFDGVHFSNELVDAFPFHLLRSKGTGWEELLVTARGDQLMFTGGAPQGSLVAQVRRLPPRGEGTIVELRPAACQWVRNVATKLRAGFILVIDYGFAREQLLSSHRTGGTFASYRAHRRDFRPLEDPGDKDITAHVDFTALAEAALDAGLEIEGYADQHHFLVGAAQDFFKKFDSPLDAASQKGIRSLNTLLHPESMGTQFRYLAFSKGIDSAPRLSGFQFSREPRGELFAGKGQPACESCAT